MTSTGKTILGGTAVLVLLLLLIGIGNRNMNVNMLLRNGIPTSREQAPNTSESNTPRATTGPGFPNSPTSTGVPDSNFNNSGSSSRSNPEKASLCTGQGGRWSSEYKECLGINEESCRAIEGSWNECASGCRHIQNPGLSCTAVCVEVCTLN